MRSGGAVPVYGSNGVVGSHDIAITMGPTIVVGRKGSYGEVNFSPVACWPIDTTYYIDKTATDVDLAWLRHTLVGLGLNTMNKAAAVPGLNRDDAYRARLVRPPLLEQRRIAAILDQAETLRAQRRAAIAQLDSLGRAIFLEMFGDVVGNPKTFPKMPLASFSTISTGSTPGRENGAYFGGTIPWVKTTEVCGEEIAFTEEMLTQEGLKAIRGKLHPVGSIAVAMYGQGQTRGRCGLLSISAATNQACGVIYPSESHEPTFLFAQLKLSYERLRALGRGGNQENLNLQLLGGFEVLLPSLQMQREFLLRSSSLDFLKASHRAALTKLDELFASLQHRAFRGEL